MDVRFGPPRPQPLGRDHPLPDQDGHEPSSLGLLAELGGLVEPARLLTAFPWLALAPRGHGESVIDLPGWRASEHTNLALRSYLRFLGYSVKPWGLGVNLGRPEADALAIADQLERNPGPEPVTLVGWSLGGTIAREIARLVPQRVSSVITFGSPVFDGPLPHFESSGSSTTIKPTGRRLDRTAPIPVPITAIFTKRDSVVDWRACIDSKSADVEHVEVRSTHMSLGFDPDVWLAIAQALAGHYRH